MFQPGNQFRSNPCKPDTDAGWLRRAEPGFGSLSTDLAAEADFADMATEGVAVHITQPRTGDHTTNETLARHIEHMADAAARLQPEVKPEGNGYHCASDSIVIGDGRALEEIPKGEPFRIRLLRARIKNRLEGSGRLLHQCNYDPSHWQILKRAKT